MNIKQLKQDKADHAATLAALKAEGWKLGAVATKDRSAEQTARLTALDAEIDTLNEQIAANATELARAERYAADERAQATLQVQVGVDHASEQPWGPPIVSNASPIAQKEALHRMLGAFGAAVRMAAYGQVDPRLQAAATGMGTQVDSSGGFTVPQPVAPGIERDMYETGEILKRVDSRTISEGNSIAYNVLDETSRADGSRGGGALGYWIDEGTAPTASNTKFARVELKLRKVGTFWVMTDELIADSVALGGELQSLFSEEMTFQVENKIIRGQGASAPLGILSAPSLVSITKETGQAAATINTTNLAKMWARMPSRSKKNAVWLINGEAGPVFWEMTQPVGTSGVAPRFITYDQDGVMRIFGRPVIEVEYAEALGTVGDVILADLSRYRLIRKGGIEQASSMHVYFSTGEQAFRAFYRVDGQPMPRSAITPFKGSATLSPFVVLQTRS